MDIWIKTDKENVDWNEVADILDESQLSHYDPVTEEKIFRNSYAVAFICDGDKIVGCGRALSDGVCQAAIYNVALRPAYQGNGFGRAIVDSLVEQVKGCTIILYTHPQTLAMYEKFGFRRQKTGFVMFAGDEEQQKWLEEEGQLPVEAGRYRLLWAPVCPWAHRSIIVRKLLGLEDVISVGKADPKRPNVSRSDWAFTLDEGDVDPVLGIHYISEVYLNADPDYQGRFTVPALVDLKTKKVVNNDYFHLTLYFETAWKKYHKQGAPDLYPEELREEIDALNDIIFREVNNGVYKAGFARSQEAYEEAYHTVFNRLDWLEERLADRRYLFGDKITESDVRLYVTLARFDVAYHNIFRVNKKRLRDYDNLWAYARDLYQTPGFGDTTDFAAIKKHYHIDCNPGNIHQIIAKGPDEEAWLLPHGREKLSENKK